MMGHECGDCGVEFDTLTGLRLHDCPATQERNDTTADARDRDETETEGVLAETGPDRAELERTHPDVVGDLPRVFDDARNGDIGALARAIAEYETALQRAQTNDVPGESDLHHEVLFAYYEPLADGLDMAAQREGWEVLVDFTETYDPDEEGEFPKVGHVIANGIGRSIVRTRRSDGVEKIPADALAYLGAIPEYVDEFHVAYEESYTYGWGIGHPEHSVSDHLVALAEEEHKFGKITLNTAFYVDQCEAIDVLERLVSERNLTSVSGMLGRKIDLTEFYFRAVGDLELEKFGPHVPMYWEENEEREEVLDVNPDVEQRIRSLAEETGVSDNLPTGWELADLDQSMMGEMADLLEEMTEESQ